MATSWLPLQDEGATLLERAVGHRDAYAEAFGRVNDELWAQDAVSPTLLELCRLRIAQLLGTDPATIERTPAAYADGWDDAALPDLSRWDTSPRFDDRQRTCLGYAEQLLYDARGAGGDLASNVIASIGEDGFIVLTYACGFFETTHRARLILADDTPEERDGDS
jgi:alkylhydroperoxidase family enzyme